MKKQEKQEKKATKSSNKKYVSRLKRKLLKLWSEVAREKDNFTCIYCGAKKGEQSPVNPESIVKIDAHHLLQKEIKNCPLKYEIKNSAVLCASCHKYNGEHSAHKSPIVFYDWLRLHHPEKYDFVLKNSSIRVDLDNLAILEEIEKKLLAKESLDIELIVKMDAEFKEKSEKERIEKEKSKPVEGEFKI